MIFFESTVRRPHDYYEGRFYSPDFVLNNSWNGAEPNFAYLNLDGQNFLDVGYVLGVDSLSDSRGFVPFDFDHDGDQDLLVANQNGSTHLYVNHWADATQNSWLKIRLADQSGSLPFGATVKVQIGNRVQAKTYSLGNSYAASFVGPIHFGLGPATEVDLVEVLWPGGTHTRINGVAVNQELVVHRTTSHASAGRFQ
jgi:hypothetical protein